MRPIWWPACVYWPKRLEFTDSLSGSMRYPPCDTVLATVPRTSGREGLTAAVRCAVHDGPVWAGSFNRPCMATRTLQRVLYCALRLQGYFAVQNC
jgi:hypothetical protein